MSKSQKLVCIKQTYHNTGKTYQLGDIIETNDPMNYSQARFTPVPDDYELPENDTRLLEVNPINKNLVRKPQSEIDKILEADARKSQAKNEQKDIQRQNEEIAYGNKLVKEFIRDTKELGLNPSQDFELMDRFKAVEGALKNGLLSAALYALGNVKIDVIFTKNMQTIYKQKITGFQNQLKEKYDRRD